MFNKKKIISLTIFSFFLIINKNCYSIDPVEIGKYYQKDVEVNFSVLEKIKENKEKIISIKKDIRTKIKKDYLETSNDKEIVKNKNKEKKTKKDFKNKSYAYIDENKYNDNISKISIFFDENSATIKKTELNNIKKFLNKKGNKDKLYLKIMAYAKSKNDDDNDSSRRISLDRAINIRSNIIDAGVPPENLIVKALGNLKKKNSDNKVVIEVIKK
tara:strand:- start:209 stop:853 length:645 start_codon:yes stop_codon:yes gene_type:complete